MYQSLYGIVCIKLCLVKKNQEKSPIANSK